MGCDLKIAFSLKNYSIDGPNKLTHQRQSYHVVTCELRQPIAKQIQTF